MIRRPPRSTRTDSLFPYIYFFRSIYCPVRVDNDDQFAPLADRVSDRMDKGFSIYLSTPPSLFAPTAMALKKAGLTGPNSRIAMEKPIGHDLPSCREVNEVMGSIFDEDRIFRVDQDRKSVV